jgi:hypothetical protein
MIFEHEHCLQMDRNKIPDDPRPLRVPSGVSKMISKPTVRSAQTMHISYIKINTISKQTETSFPNTMFGCVQNDIWAYGTFGANHAPILHWH